MLNKMLAVLKDEGFLSVSLSVQKENFAVKMYKRAGFEVVKDNGEELIMLKTYNAILTADIEDAEHICSLVQSTIKKVYPRYYAKEAVDFFCKLYSVEAIIKDIEQGSVKILLKGDKIVATGSRTGNLIAKRKSQGCLGVEMECAASIAVARFRNIPFVQFLFGADNLDCEEYDMRDLILYGRNAGNKYLSLAFECGIRLI